jgi:hypothetical protein
VNHSVTNVALLYLHVVVYVWCVENVLWDGNCVECGVDFVYVYFCIVCYMCMCCPCCNMQATMPNMEGCVPGERWAENGVLQPTV